jgi:phage shock protein A
MSIFDRISSLIRANINDLLDKAEDPEKMLDQIIRDMAEEINRARAQVAETIAQKNLVESSLANSQKMATEWQQKAELAVEKGRDDLALEALRRKRDYDANAKVYDEQLVAQRDTVDKLKADMQALQSKYEEVVRNREVLIARHKTARAQKKVMATSAAMARIDPTSELRRMEEKIRLEEARASAMQEIQATSLDRQFDDLSKDAGLDSELQALKAKRGQSQQSS